MKRFTQFANRKYVQSGMDFQDVQDSTMPLTPHAAPMGQSSEKDQRLNLGPVHLQRNKSERVRLQVSHCLSSMVAKMVYFNYEWQGLLKRPNSIISVDRHVENDSPETLILRFKSWMVNDGQKRLFFFVWCFVHLLVFTLAFLNFQLKGELFHLNI